MPIIREKSGRGWLFYVECSRCQNTTRRFDELPVLLRYVYFEQWETRSDADDLFEEFYCLDCRVQGIVDYIPIQDRTKE